MLTLRHSIYTDTPQIQNPGKYTGDQWKLDLDLHLRGYSSADDPDHTVSPK